MKPTKIKGITMRKLILAIAMLSLAACSANDIARSIDSTRAKLRTATIGLDQMKYGTKGVIDAVPQKICSGNKDDYITGLTTVKGTPVGFNSPEFLFITRYYGLFPDPSKYIEEMELQKRALLLTKLAKDIYVFSDIGREHGNVYYEWAKERIEKHQEIEMQGIISDIYHKDKGCLITLSDIAITKD
ncbi:hypothetical protein [Aggregatibacter kilianii]|uniref:hypothetical protein n=2 Tax=Aggregatibacter kilianii TaxID=2025884 RepID=UPI000D65CDFC|nr:hypothetical protein [Aggregatibacter kilianii]